MRTLALLFVLAACGGTGSHPDGPVPCPDDVADGDPCSFSDRCVHEDPFSSCLSGYCTCEAGHAHCTPAAPQTGDSCADAPISQCEYEGNPSCTTAPTSEACFCDNGTWQCECACYGGQSTCGLCDAPPSVLAGKPCGQEGGSCPCRQHHVPLRAPGRRRRPGVHVQLVTTRSGCRAS